MAIKVIDGNGGTDQLSILPGNTAATSNNKPAVVTIHPNSYPLNVNVDNLSVTVNNISVTVLNLPIDQQVNGSVTIGNFPANQSVSISNNISVTVLNPAGAQNTSVTILNSSLTISNSSITILNFPLNQSVSVSNNLSVTLLNSSLTVSINNFPITQTINGSVSVSNYPANSSVTILNPNLTVTVSNYPQNSSVTVLNTVTIGNSSVTILNFPTVQLVNGSVTIGNFPTNQSVSVSNNISVTFLNTSITVTPDGGIFNVSNNSVTVLNFPTNQSVSVSNNISTTVLNFPASQAVNGTITANAGVGLFNTRGGPNIATYSGNTVAFTPVAGDVFEITGSATKIIKILRIILCGTQTTAGNVNTVSIIKRSSADTGGTAVTMTKVPYDSASGVATATVQHYTAAPTPGTTVGTLWGPRVTIPAPATVSNAGESGASCIFEYDHWNAVNGQLPVLRSASEALCINMSAIPSGGALFEVQISWTEE